MKKRLIVVVLAITMAFGMTACGAKENTKAVINEESEDKTKISQDKETEQEGEEEASKSTGMPTLGVDDDSYDGFKYLECYEVEAEDETAIVYVPIDDYSYEGSNYVSAEDLGVTVKITLEPYLQYDSEKYTMEENLEEYISNDYEFDEFYTTDYKDVETSEINVISKEAASITSSHLEYNEYHEEYYSVWLMYYLMKTEDDRVFMAEIEINSEYTTGYTEDLLAELEAYLGIELGYDADAMQAKIDEYDPSAEGNVYSTGYWMFELPEGWGEDSSYEDSYDEYAYAPNGDADNSDCIIYITDQYVGEDTSYIKEIDEDDVVEILEDFMPDGINHVKCSVVGDTPVGYVLKSTFDVSGINVEMYFIFEGYNTYTIMAMQEGSGTEAFEAAEQIVNTAKTR